MCAVTCYYSFYEHGELIEGEFSKFGNKEMVARCFFDLHLIWIYVDGVIYDLQPDGSWIGKHFKF